MSAATVFPVRLTDEVSAILEPLVPANKPGGRPPKYSRRAIVDAIFYVVRQGCTWRALPTDLPHWNTVFWYFDCWQQDGTWDKIEDALRRHVRQAAGREAEPSAGVADSQTARATEQPGPRGYDGGKKITGIKRHVLVDTIGLVWGLAITPADVADSKGARLAVTDAMSASRRLVKIWADSAYQGFIEFALLLLELMVTIVKRRKGPKGFKVQPRRWVVERTFGWLTRWRRLNRNYEHTLQSSRAMVQVALIGIMARRLAKTYK